MNEKLQNDTVPDKEYAEQVFGVRSSDRLSGHGAIIRVIFPVT
jgi:hypothetical protein